MAMETGMGVPGIYRRDRPTIALCMIVRDEAAVIARCLESVRPLIDAWQIIDTGSLDRTREIVTGRLADLPGELHERPWRDFGSNRSELMTLARGAADYLLLLDADMTLSWHEALPPLHADAYLLRHTGAVSYWMPRLVRGDRPWRFEGSTHEYLSGEEPHHRERLEALTVRHWADGGSRADKLERDRRLLEADLEREPRNVRTAFYLAQTHRDLGNSQRAIELYRRRAGLGGWDEEVFFSLYQVGVLLAARDDDAAIPALVLASQRRPQRAEPVYELIRLLRYRRRYRAAYALARRAVELPCPADLLFVYRFIYDWGLRFELAVAAYWIGDIDRALALNTALLEDGGLPPDVEAAVRENHSYCLAHPARSASTGLGATRSAPATARPHGGVRSLSELCPTLELQPLELEVPLDWPTFNPSISAAGDGFALIVRSANYRLTDGRYHFLTGEPVIHTVNYLLGLDAKLEIATAAPLLDRAPGPEIHPSRAQGYEDCRLVRVGETWWATATVRDRNPEGRCEMALLRLEENVIAEVQLLAGPSPSRHEKNWMPFVTDAGLQALYSCDPTVVLDIGPGAGAYRELSRHAGPPAALGFRGSSQGVRTADGLLFVIHEVASRGGRRRYRHRFILLDAEYRIAGVSAPFHLTGHDVEFCAGLTARAGELLISFGVDDQSAAIAIVDAQEVSDCLRSVIPAPR